MKTVYIKFMDESGLESKVYFDRIILDMKRPAIVEHTATGENVYANETIAIVFSEPMNRTSVESAFSIIPSVSGALSWDNDTLIFTPDSNLTWGEMYIVTIGTDARDMASRNLTEPYYWEFTMEGDTDGDDIPDSLDSDIDNDGYSNEEELEAGTDPYDKDDHPTGKEDKNEDDGDDNWLLPVMGLVVILIVFGAIKTIILKRR